MLEIILMIGCFLSCWFSMGFGFIMLQNKEILEKLYLPNKVVYIGILGGFITTFACAYFMIHEKHTKEKPKYEQVTETFYRKIK